MDPPPPNPPSLLPVSLLAAGRRCLVVGGGMIAWRKIEHLLAASARVTVVAPEVCEAVAKAVDDGRIALHRRPFTADDIADDCLVAFAATDDPAVNRAVLAACQARGVLACAVDAQWPDGDFITPAVIRYAGMTIALSAGGNPVRLRRLRQRLEAWLATQSDED